MTTAGLADAGTAVGAWPRRLRNAALTAAMALLPAAPLAAQGWPGTANALTAPPRSLHTAIRAGRFVDVVRGEVLLDRLVLVAGDTIAAVLPGDAPVPAGARLFDLRGFTVLPGLMDAHSHLIGDPTSASVSAPLEKSEAQDVLFGVKNARATLLAGFTTVRDVGSYRAFVDIALREAIAARTVLGPRMLVSGPYLTVSSGGGEVNGLAQDVVVPPSFRAGVADSPAEVRMRVRQILNRGADFIKMIATGAVLTIGTKPGANEFSEEEMRAAVEEAAKYGTYVTAHAHGAEGIKMAARAGVRAIEHGSLIDDEGIRLLRARGTWLVADIYNGDYIAAVGRQQGWAAEILRKNDETTDAQRDGFRKAVAANVKLAYGTDSGVYPHGDNWRQLAYMVKYGMTPMQAIQSATIENARLLRIEQETGALVPGKLADIIAVEGDALGDLDRFAKVPFVMKAGSVVVAP